MIVASGTLAPAPPYDFDATIRFIEAFTPGEGEQSVRKTTLTKAVTVDGHAIGFSISSRGTVEQPLLAYDLYAEHRMAPETLAAARERIAFYLSADDNLHPFYERASVDPPMARLTQAAYGFHQIKFITPFENACHGLLGQRTPMAVLKRRKEALVARFGGAVRIEGELHRAFPNAQQLSAAPQEKLAQTIGHEIQARRLLGCARAFAAVDEAWLRTAPVHEVEQWLLDIEGIGPWTSGFVLIRGLGRMEYSGIVNDDAIVDAYREVYARPTATALDVRRTADAYAPLTGYWAFYLRGAGCARCASAAVAHG
jgi:DNA-3-methyladenine glycosylase II